MHIYVYIDFVLIMKVKTKTKKGVLACTTKKKEET